MVDIIDLMDTFDMVDTLDVDVYGALAVAPELPILLH